MGKKGSKKSKKVSGKYRNKSHLKWDLKSGLNHLFAKFDGLWNSLKTHHIHKKIRMATARFVALDVIPLGSVHDIEPRFETKMGGNIMAEEASSQKSEMLSNIKKAIQEKLKKGEIQKHEADFLEQRQSVKEVVDAAKLPKKKSDKVFVYTGIQGFDDLLDDGIPKGSTLILAGGAGSGKTIFGLQVLQHHANEGKKCLYMSFEESETRLQQHMDDFGWDPKGLIKKGNLVIQRFSPFDITRSVDALLMKAKGELLIDLEPVLLPEGMIPDFIVVDSLTAIASAFSGKEDSYRIYIEQLFRFFEKLNSTVFLITETKQIPTVFSQSGVEEFLADGVIVLYAIKKGNIRENAIEVLKLRGAKHQKKIVAMKISDSGIEVYPEQEVFEELRED